MGKCTLRPPSGWAPATASQKMADPNTRLLLHKLKPLLRCGRRERKKLGKKLRKPIARLHTYCYTACQCRKVSRLSKGFICLGRTDVQMPEIEVPVAGVHSRAGRQRKRKEPEVVDERTARLQKRMVRFWPCHWYQACLLLYVTACSLQKQ